MASWTLKIDSDSYQIPELIVGAVIPIILIVIGTLGNLLCITILLKKQNRKTSTNIYLIFLCIVDTLSLYQWNLSYTVFLLTNGKKAITSQSLFLCKTGEFLSFYTLHTSAMFLTFVALDRACLLWNRWYKQKIAQPHVAFIICILILLILFGINGFLFGLGTEFINYDNTTGIQTTTIACYYSLNNDLNYFFANQYAWIHLVVMYFVPFSCMFVCTMMTMKKLIVRQVSNNEQLANNAQRNRRISVMLLWMCLAYVIFTLPNRLCFSVFSNQIMGHPYTDTVFLSSNTLMYTRNALNVFFLYMSVVGFRREMHKWAQICYRKLFSRATPHQINQEEHPGTNTT